MSKINCSVSNCSHNDKNTCFANVINVGGKSAKKILILVVLLF